MKLSEFNIPRVQQWLKDNNIVVRRDRILVYKCAQGNGAPWYRWGWGRLKSPLRYRVGRKTVAPDWDGGKPQCGFGLHFGPRQSTACLYGCRYNPKERRAHFLVSVPIAEMIIWDGKVKARSCFVIRRIGA